MQGKTEFTGNGENTLKITTYEPEEPDMQLNDIASALLIINKNTIEKIIKSDYDNKFDLLSLYVFYYYTAKWQNTNQPKATDVYVRKCLKIGRDRLKKAKDNLEDIGLIKNIVRRNGQGEIIGWYVKVDYVAKKETDNHLLSENQQEVKPTCGKRDTNAFNNNINALNNNKYIYSKVAENNNCSLEKEILNHWLTKNLQKHKEVYKVIIPKQVKEYDGIDGIKQAIDNYDKVVNSDEYYFNHKWSLNDFLKRGMEKFREEASPLEMFKDKYKSNNQSTTYVYEQVDHF